MNAADHSQRSEAALQERDQRWARWLAACALAPQSALAEQAFSQLYEESAAVALSLARRIVGDAHAEDVMAEAYLQVWRQVAAFDASRGSASAWMLTIVRSRALDKLRFEKLRRAQSIEAAEEAGSDALEAEMTAHAEGDAAAVGPETLLAQTQAHSWVHRALADLSANERWVIGLAYFKDLSHSEIAAATRLPLGTVKSLVSRGLAKLRLAVPARSI
jgi:RNA polymerase sigma-70 factor, ECF subfamily